MKKLVMALAAGALLVAPASASALGLTTTTAAPSEPLVTVADPTPGGTFSGEYQCGWVTETQDGVEYYVLTDGSRVPVADWDSTDGDRTPKMCNQTGYVSAGTSGVVACNGNPELTRPDDGSPLVGYVWVGPDYAASNPTGQTPGGYAGAGNNHETADGEPTGEDPCPDNP